MADMSREEAARVLMEKVEVWEGVLKHMVPAGDFSELKQIEDYKTALRMGAAALRGWVKTADRLPTKDDADLYGLVLWMSWDREYNQCTAPYLGLYDSIIKSEYWHHISKELKLPEVEE